MRERKPRSWPSLSADPVTRAAEALTRLEDVTRLVSDLVWETDSDLRLAYVSEHAFEVMGYVPLQLEGRSFDDLGHFVDDAGNHIPLDIRKPFRDVAFVTTDAEGAPRRLLTSGLPFFDPDNGRFSGIRGTARDVTEIYRAELIRAEQEERQRAFVADVAHELRTPLAVLRTKLDTLKDEAAAAVLRDEIDGMTRLVSQMLAFARYELFRPGSEEEADLCEVCTNVATHLAPIAILEDRLIEVLAEAPVIVRGSSPALEQAVRNLVENAVRYAPRKSTVTVRITDEPAIHVIDRGAGVPNERRARIFDRFDRADRRGDGAGLGLAIVKRIIDAHGGTVRIDDPPGGGADFCVIFPAR
jgi:PAS domain S-box-containing protein